MPRAAGSSTTVAWCGAETLFGEYVFEESTAQSARIPVLEQQSEAAARPGVSYRRR
jgi:hypothetical protein